MSWLFRFGVVMVLLLVLGYLFGYGFDCEDFVAMVGCVYRVDGEDGECYLYDGEIDLLVQRYVFIE